MTVCLLMSLVLRRTLIKKSYQINILDIKYSDNEQNKATISHIKNCKSSLEYTIPNPWSKPRMDGKFSICK